MWGGTRSWRSGLPPGSTKDLGIDVSVRHLLDAATIANLAIIVESLLASKTHDQALVAHRKVDEIGEI
jgi:hypothetical protein